MFRAVVVLLLALTAQPPDGTIHGVVVDASGGVLPGVTVAARTTDGALVAVSTTTNVGRYVLTLPAGPIRLTFSPTITRGIR